MIVDLETQGTQDHFLPALVVGYDVTGFGNQFLVDLTDGAPEWMALLSPQVGGCGISYPRLLGAVLRLEKNEPRGRLPLAPFVHGLRAMGESFMKPFEPEFQVLSSLFETHGDPYTPQQLSILNSLTSRYLDLPPFESGVEALVRAKAADLTAILADWKVMTFRIREGCRHPYTSPPPPYFIEETNVFDLETSDDLPYPKVHEALRALSRFFSRQKEPGLWLLWENSD